MSVTLQGKTILVTGANGFLGQAVSYELAKLGATPILVGPNAKSCDKIYDEIETAGLAEPLLYPINLESAKEDAYSDLAMSIGQQIGTLHGFIHCAGVLDKLTPIEHFDAKQWTKTLAVELTAPFMLIKNLLPLLKHSCPSHIVLLDHPEIQSQPAYWSALAAAKGGLRELANVVRAEQANKLDLSINTVILPSFDSPNYRKLNPGKQITLPPVQPIAEKLARLFVQPTHEQTLDWSKIQFTTPTKIEILTV